MNKLLTAAMIALISTSATAATLKKDYPLCTTEDAFKEMVHALVKHDVEQFKALLLNGSCVITTEGALKYTTLDRGLLGTSKVRIYGNGTNAIAYTNYEALNH
jgi:DNA repair protein RadC